MEPPAKRSKKFTIDNILGLGVGNNYVEKLDTEIKINKKFHLTKVKSKFLISKLPPDPETLLAGIFQSCIDQTIEEGRKQQIEPDRLGCTISSEVLETDIWIPVREISINTLDSILNQFLKVSQSKKQDNATLIGEPFTVTVTAVKKKDLILNISGSRKKLAPTRHMINDNSLIKIRNSDTHCLFYALMASFIYCSNKWPRWKIYDYMHNRRGQKDQFQKDVYDLMNEIGAPKELAKYDAAEWVPRVIDFWNKKYPDRFKAFIFNEYGRYKPIFKYGSDVFQIPILLYYSNDHFDAFRNTNLFGQPYCLSCESVYHRQQNHTAKCRTRCLNCSRVGPKFPCKPIDNFKKLCNGCAKEFINEDCHNFHVSSNFCKMSKKCDKCGVIWNVKSNKQNGRQGHVCFEHYCNTCRIFHDPKRGCYMTPLKPKKHQIYRLIIFDLETMQQNVVGQKRIHEPNFIAVKITCPGCIRNEITDCNICGKFKSITFSMRPFKNTEVDKQNITSYPLTDFVNWILTLENDSVAFSHFGGRFDMVLVFKALFLKGLLPEMIKKGNKMYQMKVKNKGCTIIFRDSFNLMPMALASLVPAFALNVQDKPFFPHMANKIENYGKEIFPTRDDYLAQGMMPEKRNQFEKWFKTSKDKPFILEEQLASYCTNDVEILLAALVAFRKEFMDISDGLDVLRESMTIASACMKHFRQNHLKPQHLGIVPERGYDNCDNQSILALKFLHWYAEKHNVNIQTAHSKGGEKRIGNYRLDGWIEEENLGIEINGCCWHGCRKCYIDKSMVLPNGKTVSKQRELDKNRLEEIKSLGINVKIYWECDIKRMLKKDLEMKKIFKEYLDYGPINIRSAFYGGRTGPLKLFHKAEPDQKISYYDVTSLYPFVNVSTCYPIGHPQVHVLNKNVKWTKPLDNSYELAILKVFVIPPRHIDVPVLPMKLGDDDQRLLFPLCSSCARKYPRGDVLENYSCPHSDQQRGWISTCTSIELNEALLEGYIVTKLYRVLEFLKYDDKLFQPYISQFMSQKIHATGFDQTIKGNIEEEEQFIKECEEMFGITIAKEKMELNKGKRTLAKLSLNNLWGRFSLRNFGLAQCQIINDPSELCKKFDDNTIDINSIDELTKDVILLGYTKKDDFVEEHQCSNIIISLWTTSAARIHLLHAMQKVVRTPGCQLLYTDTDSIIFVHPKNICPLQLGPHLGQFTEEYPDYNILEYCSGGAKQYGFKLQRKDSGNVEYVLKVRGITLNKDVIENQGLHYETFKDQVFNFTQCNNISIQIVYPNFIRPSIRLGCVTSYPLKKIYKPFVGKGIVRPSDFSVLDFGYLK